MYTYLQSRIIIHQYSNHSYVWDIPTHRKTKTSRIIISMIHNIITIQHMYVRVIVAVQESVHWRVYCSSPRSMKCSRVSAIKSQCTLPCTVTGLLYTALSINFENGIFCSQLKCSCSFSCFIALVLMATEIRPNGISNPLPKMP